jgi:hypothetical protein
MTNPHNKARTAARITLGLVFAVFGLNGFIGFIPQPPHDGGAGQFIAALAATGYMFPLIKAVELVTGVLLLVGRYVPLALTLLAPVVVNIVAFHAFLEPHTIGLPLVTLGLGLYLAWTDRAAYAPLFAARSADARKDSPALGSHATTAG